MRHILILFLLCYTILCHGQSNKSEFITIKTLDKQTFIGELITISIDSVSIKNDTLGVITLAKSTISNLYSGIRVVSKHNVSEPFFIPTAIPNGESNHSYRNYALFGQNFSFGLNENLDISFGFELLSVFVIDDVAWPVMQLSAKYSGAVSNNMHIGISTKTLFNDEGGVILTSIPFTIGGLRSNFTFAPSFSQEIGDNNRAFVAMLNFNVVLSDKVRLVVDGLYIEGSLLGTPLIEITLKKNISLLAGFIYSNDFNILPNLAINVPFGSPKRQKN